MCRWGDAAIAGGGVRADLGEGGLEVGGREEVLLYKELFDHRRVCDWEAVS